MNEPLNNYFPNSNLRGKASIEHPQVQVLRRSINMSACFYYYDYEITSIKLKYLKFSAMKLTQQALKAINNPTTRRRLMDVLGCTEFTIARYIQKNSDNLTKAAAMEVIREATGLPDIEILVAA